MLRWGPTMSDLYRKVECSHYPVCKVKADLVPVEPVGTLTVGYGEMSLKADLLPPGEYMIVPKEADDE